MEKIPNALFDEAVFVNEVYSFRNQETPEKRFLVMDKIADFDKKLKVNMVSLYGTTQILQQVPAWQALIGGSIEDETNITPEQKNEINKQIKDFIEKTKAELSQ